MYKGYGGRASQFLHYRNGQKFVCTWPGGKVIHSFFLLLACLRLLRTEKTLSSDPSLSLCWIINSVWLCWCGPGLSWVSTWLHHPTYPGPGSGRPLGTQSASLGPQLEQLDRREARGELHQHPSSSHEHSISEYYIITCQLAKCCSSSHPKVLITAPPRNTRSPAWSWWRWSSRSCSSSSWPSSSWSSYLGTATTRVTKCRSLDVMIILLYCDVIHGMVQTYIG